MVGETFVGGVPFLCYGRSSGAPWRICRPFVSVTRRSFGSRFPLPEAVMVDLVFEDLGGVDDVTKLATFVV